MSSNQSDRGMYMYIDYDSVCQDIDHVLEDLRVIRSEKYFSLAFGADVVQRLKEYDRVIRKRLQDAFNLVIVGDFKRGKSTLLNAILGTSVVPVAVTPETVTINKISYSQTPKVEVVLKNGRRTPIDRSELRNEAISRMMKQFPSQIDYIDVKENIDLLADISIVDTPGIGDIFKTFDNQVANYLLNADALIYVVSAKAPLSLTEQAFLSSSVLPQSFSRVFLIINMADCLETVENIEKINKFVVEKANSINPNIYVYAVSALDEFSRRQNLNRPAPDLAEYLADNFSEFENALRNDIILQKDVIKSARGIALTRLLLNELTVRAQLLENSIKTNRQKLVAAENDIQTQNAELMESIERSRASLSLDIDQMKDEARNWISDFLVRLKQEIIGLQSSSEVGDLERHFQFFVIDMIKQALLACVDHHQREISDHLSEEARTITNEIIQLKFGFVNTQIADCITDISWTNIDSVMFVVNTADGLFGLSASFGPLILIGQAVAGFIRQKVVSKHQEDFLRPVLQEFDFISADIVNKVSDIYDQMKQKALDKLDELYQNQIDLSASVLKQAGEIALNEDVKTEELIAYMNSVLETVKTLKDTLSKYE